LHREFELDIQDLSHDGRGVGRQDGKAVFVSGALPGETVRVRQTGRNRHFDEAETLEVLAPSPDRVEPRCPHFGTCAGCVLQHLAPDRQIEAKQRVLMENLARIGHVVPATVLPPLVDAAWGYRRKGRLSVRYVEKKGRTVIGFRESNPRFVAELRECHTILPELSAQLPLKGISKIVYVSCHPGSLARDAGFLVRERGYKLVAAGAMDMFPQTAHVESIAVFER
jgi:23S rRNA (uracil1939-C5)-methyltransferase